MKKEPSGLLVALSFVLGLASGLVNIWAVWSAWHIVIVPLGFKPINWGHALGLQLFVTMFKTRPGPHHHDERTAEEKIAQACIASFAIIIADVAMVWWILPWLMA